MMCLQDYVPEAVLGCVWRMCLQDCVPEAVLGCVWRMCLQDCAGYVPEAVL